MSQMNSSHCYKLRVYGLFLHDHFCLLVYSIEREEKLLLSFYNNKNHTITLDEDEATKLRLWEGSKAIKRFNKQLKHHVINYAMSVYETNVKISQVEFESC